MAKEISPEAEEGMRQLAGAMVDAGADFALACQGSVVHLMAGDGVELEDIAKALRATVEGIEKQTPQLIAEIDVEVDDEEDI